jgi:Holliday junction resolvase RusA-like endonuclease
MIPLDNGKLYRSGNAFMDLFRLPPESEIAYTDGCREIMIRWVNNEVKFTSKAILYYNPKYIARDSAYEDYIESQIVYFIPWNNIYSIYKVKGDKKLKTYDSISLNNCLSKIVDPVIKYPFFRLANWQLVFIDKGKPKSSRSKGGKRRFKEEIDLQIDHIRQFIPKPFGGDIEIKIDVFLEDKNDHADVDRFSTHILDAFKGIVYKDDKQVKDLRPRVIDVSNAYDVLECRTDPMSTFTIEDIAPGALYPLATGIKNYYVVRMILN